MYLDEYALAAGMIKQQEQNDIARKLSWKSSQCFQKKRWPTITVISSRELFDKICQKYPCISISYGEIKKFTASKWEKSIKQFPELGELERTLRMEKRELAEKRRRNNFNF